MIGISCNVIDLYTNANVLCNSYLVKYSYRKILIFRERQKLKTNIFPFILLLLVVA